MLFHIKTRIHSQIVKNPHHLFLSFYTLSNITTYLYYIMELPGFDPGTSRSSVYLEVNPTNAKRALYQLSYNPTSRLPESNQRPVDKCYEIITVQRSANWAKSRILGLGIEPRFAACEAAVLTVIRTKQQVPLGIEPRLQDSESWVITIRPWDLSKYILSPALNSLE